MAKSDDDAAEVFLYDLTEMTGKKAQKQRTQVVLTVEMRRGTMIALIVSIFPALFVTGLLWPLLDIYSVLVALAVFGACMFALLYRQRRGLQVSQYAAWMDRRSNRTDVFIQCNRIIDPLESSAYMIVRSSRPSPIRRHVDLDQALEEALS